MKFYHYSTSIEPINILKIGPIININNSVRNKPKQTSGLWGSPVTSQNGWEKFCIENNMFVEMIKYRTTFELNDNARVITFEDCSDLIKLKDFLLPNNTGFNNVFIDWEKLSTCYDAIIVKIKPLNEIDINDEYIEFWRYFCDWDVDSILVLNSNAICYCSEPEYLVQYDNMKSSPHESYFEIRKKELKKILNIYYN